MSRLRKNGERWGKGADYNPWKLWSDPCGGSMPYFSTFSEIGHLLILRSDFNVLLILRLDLN